MSTPGQYDNFVPHRDTHGNETQEFEAITAVHPWSTASFEQIRLHAYSNHPVPRSQWAASPSTRTAFNSLAPGLKHVSLQLSGGFSPVQPKRPFRELSPETIQFDVGKDSTFTVHANLAMDASKFVRMALKPGWKEVSTLISPAS